MIILRHSMIFSMRRNKLREKPSFIEDVVKHEDSLDELSALVYQQLQLEAQIKEVEESLDILKKAHRRVAGEDIPNVLLSRGLSSIKLSTGEKVDVTQDVNVSIKDQNAFFEFLRERKEDGIIKMMFSFDRMPSEKLDELLELLQENGYQFDFDVNVHPNTRKKYFKILIGLEEDDDEERLKGFSSGKYIRVADLPEWCSVFVIYKTRIK